jgi:hypothetical protein
LGKSKTIKKIEKISIDKLIKEKAKYAVKKDKTEELYIPSLDASVVVGKPDRSLCMEALKMEEDGDTFLVYSCMLDPSLKDSELHKAYGCVEPTEIVEKIFEPGEIVSISQKCLDMAGYSNEIKAVEDLKN